MNDTLTLYDISCSCDSKLRVLLKSLTWFNRCSVKCPCCKREHETPQVPVKLLWQEKNGEWQEAPL
jgi:hypothetical protein